MFALRSHLTHVRLGLRLSPARSSCVPVSTHFVEKRYFGLSRLLFENIKPDQQQAAPQVKKVLPKMSAAEYKTLRDQYQNKKRRKTTLTAAYYSVSLTLIFLSLAFASVPLYRFICQKTGWAGTPMTDKSKITPDMLVPVDTDRKIRVSFTAETSRMLPWKFVPQQREVYLVPGETALAFYKAKNVSENDITGMATYSVTPDHIAPYFNKIQCFCFEEQRLNAGEEIDMPLFFFIDPDIALDPAMKNIDDIVLHYTFFKAAHEENKNLSMKKQEGFIDYTKDKKPETEKATEVL